MNDSELPVHWRFASGQAFAGLRELVRSFDFLRNANGHTYVGIEPGYLVEVVDGFLGEPEDVVFGGDRANLSKLRKILVEQLQPAHRQGLEAGRRCWHDCARTSGSLSIEELHRLALEWGPSDEMLRGWFAEGFCFAYANEEVESLRGVGVAPDRHDAQANGCRQMAAGELGSLGGGVSDIRIAVSCDDPAEVASTLQRELDVEFEARDSSFWGVYWTESPRRHIRVFFNEDPMYSTGSDPPNEFYFEASVPNHRTLVDVEDDETMGKRVAKILAARYPDSRIVLGSSA